MFLRMLSLVTFSCLFPVKLPVLHVHLLWYVCSLPEIGYYSQLTINHLKGLSLIILVIYEVPELIHLWTILLQFFWKSVDYATKFVFIYNHIRLTSDVKLLCSMYKHVKHTIMFFLLGCCIWGRRTYTQAWRGLCCIFANHHGKI